MTPSQPAAAALQLTPVTTAYVALGFGVLCIGLSAIFVKLAGVPGFLCRSAPDALVAAAPAPPA
jgi:hypothetical protein